MQQAALLDITYSTKQELVPAKKPNTSQFYDAHNNEEAAWICIYVGLSKEIPQFPEILPMIC